MAEQNEQGGVPKLIINGRGEERSYGSPPKVEKVVDDHPLIDTRQLAQEIAKAQGLLSPEQYLEDYRDAEEFLKAPFQIVPGAEPRFWPLLNEKEKQEWMIRSTLVIAAYKKSLATGTDKLYMDEMRELAVDLNKRALKVLFGSRTKEGAVERPEYEGVDGVLPATGIYCTIIGDKRFYSLADDEKLFYDHNGNPIKDNLKEVFCSELSEGEKKELIGDYGEYAIQHGYRDINGVEHKGLFDLAKDLRKTCPDSIYPHDKKWGTNISQESFRKLRESIRFWLTTRGRDLLLTVEERNRREDFYNGVFWENGRPKQPGERDLGIDVNSPEWKNLSKEEKDGLRKDMTKLYVYRVLQDRARDAEQIAWNFVYSTSVLENFDSRAYRPEGTKRHGPSNYWTLFQWMAMHPQERFEQKIVRGTEAKEEWSALGTWGIHNVSTGVWAVNVGGRVEVRVPENLRVLPDSLIRSPLFPSMHQGMQRLDGGRSVLTENGKKEDEKCLFNILNSVGRNVLYYKSGAKREELESRIDWGAIGDAPFVPFIFDEMRWADVVLNVFKKGGQASRIGLPDLGEAMRNLRLNHESREKLLAVYFGINANSKELKPKEPRLDWELRKVALKEYFPNLFLEK